MFSLWERCSVLLEQKSGCVTLTSSSIKVSGDTENMLFLLLACVIKAHLHTEKGAQEGKGKKGNPGKTLTWVLSQETATPQRLISTHGEEQSGGTPKPPQRNEASHWLLQGQPQGISSPGPITCQWHQARGITQNTSPGHLTNWGVTAWGNGTLYRMQGEGILHLYEIYGVFCGGNKSWEQEKSRRFGKAEVWKLGRKRTKGADVNCFLPIYFSSCALCLAIPVCPAFPIHTLLLWAWKCVWKSKWQTLRGDQGLSSVLVLLMMKSKIYFPCEEQVIFPPTVLKFNLNNCKT